MAKLKGGMIKLKARKLPSGKWNVQVLDYVDADGKRHVKSFTAATRAEAEFQAAKFKTERTEGGQDGAVYDMVARAIRDKAPALSPATLRGYDKILRTNISVSPFGKIRVAALNSQKVQAWISWMLTKGLSPKSIKNAYGVFSSCYQYSGGEKLFKVKFPQASAGRRRVPSQADVVAVMRHFQDDPDMTAAIRLGAFAGLRRGEICALTAKDINRKNRTIWINKSVTQGKDGSWITKVPKTEASVRLISVSDFVLEALPERGKVVNIMPYQITNEFGRAMKDIPVIPFSFHDLRHFYASKGHNKGMSDTTLQANGGWSSSVTPRAVYMGEIPEDTRIQTGRFNDYVDTEIRAEFCAE